MHSPAFLMLMSHPSIQVRVAQGRFLGSLLAAVVTFRMCPFHSHSLPHFPIFR